MYRQGMKCLCETYHDAVLTGIFRAWRDLAVATARDVWRNQSVGVAALAAGEFDVSLEDVWNSGNGESSSCESCEDHDELHFEFVKKNVLKKWFGVCELC